MVIPLMKQAADELGVDEHARLRYAAAWGTSAPAPWTRDAMCVPS